MRVLTQLNPGPSQLASSLKVAAHFGKSRQWAHGLLKQWWEEQQQGGIPRVLKKGRTFYTTMAVLYANTGRGRDEHLHRRICELELTLGDAMARINELEKRIGKRR